MNCVILTSFLLLPMIFQFCLCGGRTRVDIISLVSAADPPRRLDGTPCAAAGTTCTPFLRICFTDTTFESCEGSAYYTPTYDDGFPVDFSALPGFEIEDNVVDMVTVGLFVYDKTSDDRLELSANTPLADLTATFPVSRGVVERSTTSNMYTITYRFTVECDPNFYGDDCATECVASNSDVTGHYTCSNEAPIFICNPGYTNPTVSPPCNDVISLCFPNPCSNGACSMVEPGLFDCACPQGFQGRTCDDAVNACDYDPCFNGGACVSESSGGFTCVCPAGFAGPSCETTVNPCDASPCMNGGVCLRTSPTGFTCICPEGTTGDDCGTDINECDPNPCLNEGICTETTLGQFSCECPMGLTGETCDEQVNPCDDEPCRNGGKCSLVGLGVFSCSCGAGFTGDTCETDINECTDSPCQNGGKCTNSIGGFTCCCAEKFTGPVCEHLQFKYDLRDFTKVLVISLRKELLHYCPAIAFKTPYIVHVIGKDQDECFYWVAIRYRGFVVDPHQPRYAPPPPDPAKLKGSSPNTFPGTQGGPVIAPTPTPPEAVNPFFPRPRPPPKRIPPPRGPSLPIRPLTTGNKGPRKPPNGLVVAGALFSSHSNPRPTNEGK